ncbi:MAG: hypothetical protein MHM6MM_008496 [Cercozoa sp. M6MM]
MPSYLHLDEMSNNVERMADNDTNTGSDDPVSTLLSRTVQLLGAAFYSAKTDALRDAVLRLDRNVLEHIVVTGFADGRVVTSPRALLMMAWVDVARARRLVPDPRNFLSVYPREMMLYVFQPTGVFTDAEIIEALKDATPIHVAGPAEVELTYSDAFREIHEREWRAALQQGDQVDAIDTVHMWYRCNILEADAERILIHYIGWPDRWNEYIDRNSERLMPAGTVTQAEGREHGVNREQAQQRLQEHHNAARSHLPNSRSRDSNSAGEDVLDFENEATKDGIDATEPLDSESPDTNVA